MKLVSWNVNGLRACLQKGFAEYPCARWTRTSSACRRPRWSRTTGLDMPLEGYEMIFN